MSLKKTLCERFTTVFLNDLSAFSFNFVLIEQQETAAFITCLGVHLCTNFTNESRTNKLVEKSFWYSSMSVRLVLLNSATYQARKD